MKAVKWFARKWTGYQICIGAAKEGDNYTHCIPLRDTGEFGGYSNKRLTLRIVKMATEAAESLGFPDPFWRDSEGKITMAPKHEAKKGTSRTFHPDVAKKHDVASHIAAHEAIISELKEGNIKPIGDVKVVDGPASDGSGLDAQTATLEYAFVHGKPAKDVQV